MTDQATTAAGVRRSVVVGVDGSAGSRAALVEAVRSAGSRGDGLRVIAVYETPEVQGPWRYGAVAGLRIPSREELATAALDEARTMVDEVVAELPEPPSIEVEALPGRAAEVLVEASQEAAELVIGHRGRGAMASALLGSVSLSCVLHARCPVTVVPPPRT